MFCVISLDNMLVLFIET